jgi:hypothetical protein
VDRYRDVIARLESEPTEPGKQEFRPIAMRLRRPWRDWQGVDSLLEVVFGGTA